jgi:uncharacterized protein YndB with AHSA1/START domain
MPVATTRITPDQDAVVSEVDIAAPPERVFQALIDSKQARQWGTGENYEVKVWEIDARPGGKWHFVSQERSAKKAGSSPQVFEHHGEYLEVTPPSLLVHTWFANWHENPSHKTVVRWELTPIPTGTRLKVTHSGLLQLPTARDGYSQGWPGLVEAIKKFVEK